MKLQLKVALLAILLIVAGAGLASLSLVFLQVIGIVCFVVGLILLMAAYYQLV